VPTSASTRPAPTSSAEASVGPKLFHTASGDLTLEEITGELEIEAVSGDTRIGADGSLQVRARSISGDFPASRPEARPVRDEHDLR